MTQEQRVMLARWQHLYGSFQDLQNSYSTTFLHTVHLTQQLTAKFQWLAVWLSGNALASINVVVLCQTQLVPGWVTVCGQVNRLGM